MKHNRASPWKESLARLGWAVAEGLIGAGVGLLVVTLYLRGR
jgi:hypothetical protein